MMESRIAETAAPTRNRTIRFSSSPARDGLIDSIFPDSTPQRPKSSNLGFGAGKERNGRGANTTASIGRKPAMSSSALPFPRILLGPGPSTVSTRVLEALGRAPIGYLDPE